MPWGQFFTVIAQVAIVVIIVFVASAMLAGTIDAIRKRR